MWIGLKEMDMVEKALNDKGSKLKSLIGSYEHIIEESEDRLVVDFAQNKINELTSETKRIKNLLQKMEVERQELEELKAENEVI